MRRRDLLGLALAAAVPAAKAQRRYNLIPMPEHAGVPVLDATDLRGRVWRLSALRGRAVLLNFWATWCPPCRAEMPSLQQIDEIYGERLQVLAVNVRETPQQIAQFLQRSGLNLTVLLDGDGAISRRWAAQALPVTYLIDASGSLRWRVLGEVDWTGRDAAELIEPLLAGYRSKA